MWAQVADERTFADIDSPEDLARLGLGGGGADAVEQ
jgi:hypothetical protein